MAFQANAIGIEIACHMWVELALQIRFKLGQIVPDSFRIRDESGKF